MIDSQPQQIIIPLPFYIIKRVLNFYLSLTNLSGSISKNVKYINNNLSIIVLVSKQWNSEIIPRLAYPYFAVVSHHDIQALIRWINIGFVPKTLFFNSNQLTISNPKFKQISKYITKYFNCEDDDKTVSILYPHYMLLNLIQLSNRPTEITNHNSPTSTQTDDTSYNISRNVKYLDIQIQTNEKQEILFHQFNKLYDFSIVDWSLDEINFSFKLEDVSINLYTPHIRRLKTKRLILRDVVIQKNINYIDTLNSIPTLTSLSILNFTMGIDGLLKLMSHQNNTIVHLSLRNIRLVDSPNSMSEITQFDNLFKCLKSQNLKTFYFDPWVISSVGKVGIGRLCRFLNQNLSLEEFHSSVFVNDFKPNSYNKQRILSDQEKYRIENTTLRRLTGCNIFLKNHILQFWHGYSKIRELSITNVNPMISRAITESHFKQLESLTITNIRYFNRDSPFPYVLTAFVQAYHFKYLRTLNLATNELYVKYTAPQAQQDWKDFFSEINKNRNLTNLTLYKFDLPVDLVLEFLESNHPTISYFSIELFIDKIHPTERFKSALANNTKLSSFNMASSLPTNTLEENFEFILFILQRNSTIQHFNFNDNPIPMDLTSQQIETLSQSLIQNSSLLTFLNSQIYEVIPHSYIKSSKLSSFDPKLSNNYLFNLK